MKKTLIFALLTFSSIAGAEQEPIYSVSSSQFFTKQTKPATHKPSIDDVVAAKSGHVKGQSEVMIITPASRAKDIHSAFQYLRTMSPATKIGVKLTDGSIISEILDINVMPGGTMIIFKINTMKGEKYRVVKIEQIDSLTHV
ncbi:MAG: hypothetical protein K1060chlam2_00005 [Chlamydiae bacterium]|nr:hypothetical protein [Chlamydiota bacterium]